MIYIHPLYMMLYICMLYICEIYIFMYMLHIWLYYMYYIYVHSFSFYLAGGIVKSMSHPSSWKHTLILCLFNFLLF